MGRTGGRPARSSSVAEPMSRNPYFAFAIACVSAALAAEGPVFRAGAFAVDITPNEFPVIVNGGFLEKVASEAHGRLHARAIVMENGAVRVAVVVADTCMMPRDLL